MTKYVYELTGRDRLLDPAAQRAVVIENLDYDVETEMVIISGYYEDDGEDFYAEMDADGTVSVQ